MSETDFTCPRFDHQASVIDWRIGAAAPDIGDMPLAAVIGNCEGVHRGHQALLDAAAGIDGMRPAVITFDPHPRRFFKPDAPGFLLSDARDKAAFLANAGAEVIIRARFDDAMRATDAADFIGTVLPALGVGAVVAGEDFAFGADRGGDLGMVKASGIRTAAVPPVMDGGEAISSSRIRAALAQGAPGEAARLMGRPFTISGEVIKGDRRGHELGFPTANMVVGDIRQPKFGIYTVAVRDAASGKVMAGVANFGIRPSVNDRGVLLESHVFDYDGDLYGRRLNIMLLDYIREEAELSSLDELKQWIERDCEVARAYHAGKTGLLK